MRINHNIAAANTHRQLTGNTSAASKSLEKLSSGFRINRAGDDAAGLAISEKMRAQIRGLDMAAKNSQDGISLIQTAEGALNETHSILQRVRELADQSANGTNTDDDRKALQNEVKQLKEEIDRIGNTTEFNTQKLLNGALQSSGVSVGTNSTNGAKVLNQTAAKLTSATDFDSIDGSGITITTKDTIKIDKAEISIDWDKGLTDSEKALIQGDYSTTAMTDTQKNDIKNALNRVVNEAIDAYNAANGASVSNVKIYEAAGKLVMESGKVGQDSQIDFGASAGVLDVYLDAATQSNSGQDQVAVAVPAETLSFEINGVKLQTATLATAAASSNATTVATDIQTKIRAAVDSYNTDAGLTKGMEGFIDKDAIFVEAKDGRFVVSSTSGAITFNEREGSTLVKNLGLTQAQTDAAGNGGMTFQIGANRGQTISFGIGDMRSAALGIANVDISTKSGASLALDTMDKAIKSVSAERSKMGAVQNRLEHTINNLQTASENLSAAESRIRDVDMAKEMMDFTKNNILSQAAQAMLAQANQQPQGVLQLLR
ncbi:flagellin [Paenibacillus contaminans]|uniref:Flagellin n=1 Tax=Paenibacillus contaminans TaxID=450362 RepID=A0A329MBX7_9BACL|nr:flagellin [Paenibacillus contaminans]RAV17404.1 flagellin [Paenibacillus contaminans]